MIILKIIKIVAYCISFVSATICQRFHHVVDKNLFLFTVSHYFPKCGWTNFVSKSVTLIATPLHVHVNVSTLQKNVYIYI